MLRGGPAFKIGDMLGIWGGFHPHGRKKLQFSANLNYSTFSGQQDRFIQRITRSLLAAGGSSFLS